MPKVNEIYVGRDLSFESAGGTHENQIYGVAFLHHELGERQYDTFCPTSSQRR